MIGEAPRLARVVRKLVVLTTDIETEGWSPEFEVREPSTVAGVVLVGPVKRTGMPAAVRRLAAQVGATDAPICVIAPDGTGDRAVRALYRAGATAVFLWPGEARHLAALLAESMGASMARGTPDSGDDALVRTIKTHLRKETPLPPKLRIEARKGVVELSGEVESLPRKRRIVDVVSRIRGVKGTVAAGLVVAPSGRSDRAVSKDVRAVLKAVSEIADDTLSVTVQNGYVNVAGSIADHREMARLVDVLRNVRGVRGIHNYVTISRSQKANDRALTRRLGELIEERFPRERVGVSVFGHVAVLDGRVARLSIKRELEAAALDHPSIERVVNKVVVK